jgi:hypothetical protein
MHHRQNPLELSNSLRTPILMDDNSVRSLSRTSPEMNFVLCLIQHSIGTPFGRNFVSVLDLASALVWLCIAFFPRDFYKI